MKDNLIRGWKLMGYGLSVKGNVVCLVLFFVMGLALELVQAFVGVNMADYTTFDTGAVFMSCAAMFFSQLVISVDVSLLAQTSGYKKKIQTSMPTVLMGAGALVVLTLLAVIRGIAAALDPQMCMQHMEALVTFAAIEALIILYSALIYKFFVLALVVLYLVMIGFGTVSGLMSAGRGGGFVRLFAADSGSLLANPVVCIIASYVLVLLALVIQYGISRLLYKRPLSKYAFGAAMKRSM